RIAQYTSLLESFNIEYYLPSSADEKSFSLSYITDHPTLSGKHQWFLDITFLDTKRVKDIDVYEKCAEVSNASNKYSSVVVRPNQQPCRHLGVINGFDVWTQALPRSKTFNLYKNDQLLILDGDYLG